MSKHGNIVIAKKFTLSGINNNGDITHTYCKVVYAESKNDALIIESYTLCSDLKDKPAQWVRTITLNGVTKYLMKRSISLKLKTFRKIYTEIEEYL